MAERFPTNRLKSVDLPTFGRPTRATAAWAYQIVGADDAAPVELLDNLVDIAQGEPPRHDLDAEALDDMEPVG